MTHRFPTRLSSYRLNQIAGRMVDGAYQSRGFVLRKSILATALLVATAAPLGACAGDNGGLFSSGDRVYNPDTVDRGARDGDRVYRDRDGRYYCQREDGTTGPLVGAGVGALLGKDRKSTRLNSRP